MINLGFHRESIEFWSDALERALRTTLSLEDISMCIEGLGAASRELCMEIGRIKSKLQEEGKL